jgi:hypothetical protein
LTSDASHYLWLVQLDIPEHLDDEFNRIYDTEHAPALSRVPGVLGVQRYVLEKPSDGAHRYITLYRVDSPDLPQSPEWRAASAEGSWQSTIVPHVTSAKLAIYRAMS